MLSQYFLLAVSVSLKVKLVFFFTSANIAVFPIFWCIRYRALAECANCQSWSGRFKLHALYGKKQTNNITML